MDTCTQQSPPDRPGHAAARGCPRHVPGGRLGLGLGRRRRSGIWSGAAGRVDLQYLELHGLATAARPGHRAPTPREPTPHSAKMAANSPARRHAARPAFSARRGAPSAFILSPVRRRRTTPGPPWLPRPTMRPTVATTIALPARLGFGPSNCGNADCGPPPSSIPNAPALVAVEHQGDDFQPQTNRRGTGPMVPRELSAAMMMTSAAQITDGLANTYLVGEKYLEPELVLTGQDPGDNECAYIGDNQDITRYTQYHLSTMQDRLRAWIGSIHGLRQPARQRLSMSACATSRCGRSAIRSTPWCINIWATSPMARPCSRRSAPESWPPLGQLDLLQA